MIVLHLLHPIDATPVQTWRFASGTLIRVGRSSTNDVVLLSSVVSRHHLEFCRVPTHWEVVSLGANGTYLDGQQIERAKVVDGSIVRLASTGPKLQVRMDLEERLPIDPEELERRRREATQVRVEAELPPRKERSTLMTPS